MFNRVLCSAIKNANFHLSYNMILNILIRFMLSFFGANLYKVRPFLKKIFKMVLFILKIYLIFTTIRKKLMTTFFHAARCDGVIRGITKKYRTCLKQ